MTLAQRRQSSTALAVAVGHSMSGGHKGKSAGRGRGKGATAKHSSMVSGHCCIDWCAPCRGRCRNRARCRVLHPRLCSFLFFLFFFLFSRHYTVSLGVGDDNSISRQAGRRAKKWCLAAPCSARAAVVAFCSGPLGPILPPLFSCLNVRCA